MKLDEFFKRLSFGELSNLSVGSEGSGALDPTKRNKFVHYTNEALLMLHARFILIENDLLLEQQDWKTTYKLDRTFALSNEEADETSLIYINDLHDPFQNDVIKILSVSDAMGCSLPLNDQNDPASLFTPTPDTIQVPNPIQGALLGIGYQARHPILPYDDFTSDINLPSVLEPALAKYVAYLTYSHMNGQENAVKGAEHLKVYEGICKNAEDNDLISTSYSTTNTKFEKGGWA